MKQLECRKYSREEIAEILSIPVKDSHFARNVKQTLDKWGYKYNYTRTAVTITDKPQTAQERLKELLIRGLKVNIQTDSYEFSCFLYELAKSDEFQSMPWGKRVDVLLEKYGVSVSEKTLRNWCAHLIRE